MKIPSIKIKTDSWSKISKPLSAVCSFPPTAYLADDLIQFKCTTIADYQASLNYLKTASVEHFTFCLPTARKPQMVIRGLPSSTHPSTILQALQEHDINADSVTQIFTTRPLPHLPHPDPSSPPPKRPTPVFIILLNSINDLPRFNSLQSLLGLSIRSHPYQQPKEPVQCRNCLTIGHTANYCHLHPRCKKCGLSHASHQCPNSNHDPIKCLNCNAEHSTTYHGCPKFQQAKQAMRRRATTSASPAAQPPLLTSSNFPPLPHRNPWTSNHPSSTPDNSTNNPASSPTNPLNNLLGLDLPQLLQSLLSSLITQLSTAIKTIIANIFQIHIP